MKKHLFIYCSFTLIAISAVAQKAKKNEPIKEQMVMISTELGDIKLKLYNETPKHRDNFIKLVKDTFYNGTLFHRIIKDFMIQGGDPQSRNAQPNAMLGEGDVGYTIPAEIVPQYYHKKGALAAARQGDDVNPTKASSGCQFYIVQGRQFTQADLTSMEARMNFQRKQTLFNTYISKPENANLKARFMNAQQTQNADSLQALSKLIEPVLEAEAAKLPPYKYSEEQVKTYTTVGGTPHLDANYTVFGEVVEGLDVVDKIAASERNQNDRPVKDIKMTIKLVD